MYPFAGSVASCFSSSITVILSLLLCSEAESALLFLPESDVKESLSGIGSYSGFAGNSSTYDAGRIPVAPETRFLNKKFLKFRYDQKIIRFLIFGRI